MWSEGDWRRGQGGQRGDGRRGQGGQRGIGERVRAGNGYIGMRGWGRGKVKTITGYKMKVPWGVHQLRGAVTARYGRSSGGGGGRIGCSRSYRCYSGNGGGGNSCDGGIYSSDSCRM